MALRGKHAGRLEAGSTRMLVLNVRYCNTAALLPVPK